MAADKPRKRIVIIVTVAVLLLALIFGAAILYNHEFVAELEQVAELDSDVNEDIYWFTLRSESYSPFFEKSYLENIIADKTEISDLKLDYDKYTYVVTVGHKLKSLSYSYSSMKNRVFGFIPKQFVGIVDLSSQHTDKVYIYRIKKMDIDCDYHDRESNVTFS